MTHALGAVALFLADAPAPKKGGSSLFLPIILAIGAAFYFLIYRPQQRKQKAAQAQARTWEVGDEVVTAGGIVGRVLDITDDRVTLETSVGASFTVLRPYVLRRLDPLEPPPDVVDDHDDQDVHESPTPPPRPIGPGATGGSDAPAAGGAAPGGPPPAHPADGSGEGDDGTNTGGSDGPPII
jgi:preprotein translocase subunit YajC